MKKYSTAHIREKSLTEQAALAHMYYRRARKAEDERDRITELLSDQQKENATLRDSIRQLYEDAGLSDDH